MQSYWERWTNSNISILVTFLKIKILMIELYLDIGHVMTFVDFLFNIKNWGSSSWWCPDMKWAVQLKSAEINAVQMSSDLSVSLADEFFSSD